MLLTDPTPSIILARQNAYVPNYKYSVSNSACALPTISVLFSSELCTSVGSTRSEGTSDLVGLLHPLEIRANYEYGTLLVAQPPPASVVLV